MHKLDASRTRLHAMSNSQTLHASTVCALRQLTWGILLTQPWTWMPKQHDQWYVRVCNA